MKKFYLNGKEVSKEVFERSGYVHESLDWRIDTMELNGTNEYMCKNSLNKTCKIVID